MDLILTQHIVSMRMPEGKYVFWLKKKNRSDNLSEFRHIAFETPLNDGSKVTRGSDGIDGLQPALPVTWKSLRVLRKKAECLCCIFSGHSRVVQ